MGESRTNADGALHCARHRHTVTYLRCANCGTPICPQCLIMTPVGAKCPDCGRVKLAPMFVFGPLDAVLVLVATLVGGLALGLAASVLSHLAPVLGSLLRIFFPLAAGWILAAAIRRIAGKKSSIALKIFAGLGVIIAWIALGLGDFIVRGPLELLQSGMLPTLLLNLGLNMIMNPFMALFVIVGIWVAIQRVEM